MWQDIILAGSGMLFGLLTGFYFERRTTITIRRHNAELERELGSLRSSIYTVGAVDSGPPRSPTSEDSLKTSVHSRARLTQGADGRTSRTQLTSHFFALGHRVQDVDSAISALCDSGKLRAEGKWLVVR